MRAKEKHGMARTPEYSAWHHMIQRCHNKNDKRYYDYGGRGIKVCAAWRNSFVNFFNHVGKRPSKRHQIERIKNDLGYEPGNVEWTTRHAQARNKRNNHMITWKGETMCMRDWAKRFNVPEQTLQMRLARGWSLERAFTENIFDCVTCGSCCHMDSNNSGHTVLNKTDIKRLKPMGLVVIHPRFRLPVIRTKPYKDGGVVCSALQGKVTDHVSCGIYSIRPAFCIKYKPGSDECLEARKNWNL